VINSMVARLAVSCRLSSTGPDSKVAVCKYLFLILCRVEQLQAPMPIQSGIHLGHYEIVAVIGAGGMGEVYRARDTRLDRIVAVKILPNRLADPGAELRERFKREARAIASLHHPHICTPSWHRPAGRPDYLVMECQEGETLAQRLAKGPLPLEQALQ
jgi:serine/threonine protein kinase